MAIFPIGGLLKEQTHKESASRSDVLKALIWPIGILLAAVISLSAVHAPDWAVVVAFCFLAVFTAIYAFAYVFCLLKNPDYLRSEQYSLNKMALEQGLYGDSSIGLIERTTKRQDVIAIESSAERVDPE